MCVTVTALDGTEIQTVAELRAIWPTLIEIHSGPLEPSGDEDYCLCGIDIPGSACVNGARVELDPDWGDYAIKSRTP